MRRATLRQLQIFAAVAENKSFTRAAEQLFLTQSTVSTQLKQLSEFIGHPLVEHIGKKIIITPVGERVAQLYQQLDEQWSRFEEDMDLLASPHKGSIKVCGVNTCQYFFPRVLGAFHQQYPDINISLKVFNRQQVLERIAQNSDDLYIMGLIPETLDLKAIPFAENPLVVIAHPQHPLAHAKQLSPAVLSKETFIAREPGSGTRREINRMLDQYKLSIESQIELGSNEAIKQAVIGGLGISVLSVYAVALELRLGLLCSLDVEGFPLKRGWNIAYHAGKAISPATRTFIDFLKEDGRRIASAVLQDAHMDDSVDIIKKQLAKEK